MSKQIALRRTGLDTYYLKLLGESLGLNDSAMIRLALRDYAYRHGYAHRDMQEILILLRNLAAVVRTVDGAEKLLARADKLLNKHSARLQRVYEFEGYPRDVEDELVEEEKVRRKAKRYRLARPAKS